MTVTPTQITERDFRSSWRGYDQKEVDAFLDVVAARLAAVTRERDALTERLESVESQAAEAFDAERLLRQTLVAAQRAADETVADARATAQRTVSQARDEAERIVVQAQDHAAAEEERAARVGAAVRQAVEELHSLRARYRQQVRMFLEAAAELPELPAPIAELSGGDSGRQPDAPPPQPDGDLGGQHGTWTP